MASYILDKKGLEYFWAKSKGHFLSQTAFNTALEELNGAISAIPKFKVEVGSSLPTASADYMATVYLVTDNSASSPNLYTEYVCVRSGSEGSYTYAWEMLGTQALDLSGYLTDAKLTATKSGQKVTGKIQKKAGNGSFADITGGTIEVDPKKTGTEIAVVTVADQSASIQVNDATNAAPGLMTAAQVTKLESITVKSVEAAAQATTGDNVGTITIDGGTAIQFKNGLAWSHTAFNGDDTDTEGNTITAGSNSIQPLTAAMIDAICI